MRLLKKKKRTIMVAPVYEKEENGVLLSAAGQSLWCVMTLVSLKWPNNVDRLRIGSVIMEATRVPPIPTLKFESVQSTVVVLFTID